MSLDLRPITISRQVLQDILDAAKQGPSLLDDAKRHLGEKDRDGHYPFALGGALALLSMIETSARINLEAEEKRRHAEDAAEVARGEHPRLERWRWFKKSDPTLPGYSSGEPNDGEEFPGDEYFDGKPDSEGRYLVVDKATYKGYSIEYNPGPGPGLYYTWGKGDPDDGGSGWLRTFQCCLDAIDEDLEEREDDEGRAPEPGEAGYAKNAIEREGGQS